jgi:hypothetical protein
LPLFPLFLASSTAAAEEEVGAQEAGKVCECSFRCASSSAAATFAARTPNFSSRPETTLGKRTVEVAPTVEPAVFSPVASAVILLELYAPTLLPLTLPLELPLLLALLLALAPLPSMKSVMTSSRPLGAPAASSTDKRVSHHRRFSSEACRFSSALALALLLLLVPKLLLLLMLPLLL